MDGGAKRVIITAPSIDASMIVYGVNHTCYDPKKGKIISAASCTTNCAAPIIRLMHDKFDVIEVMISSVHALTSMQRTLDGPLERGKVFTKYFIKLSLFTKTHTFNSFNSYNSIINVLHKKYYRNKICYLIRKVLRF